MISNSKLVRVNIKNRFQRDTAYFGDNWANLVSTITYTIVQISAIVILFSFVEKIGPYNQNDILFLMVVGQVHFYFITSISLMGADWLDREINKGGLDFLFIRPINQKIYLYSHNFSLVSMLRDSLPAMIPITLYINWSELSLSPKSLILGGFIFVCAWWIDHLLTYTLALPSFWFGKSEQTIKFFWANRADSKLPFEISPTWFKGLAFTLIPSFLISAVAGGVMLNKFSAFPWIFIVAGLAVAWTFFFNFLWSKAVKQYASASS